MSTKVKLCEVINGPAPDGEFVWSDASELHAVVEEASSSAKLICQLVKRTGKQCGMEQIGQSVGGTSVLRQYSFGYGDGSCKPSPLT